MWQKEEVAPLAVMAIHQFFGFDCRTNNTYFVMHLTLSTDFCYSTLQTYQKSIMLLLAMMEKGLNASSFPIYRLHQEIKQQVEKKGKSNKT